MLSGELTTSWQAYVILSISNGNICSFEMDNVTREQSGLLDAMNVLKINTGFIVTIDQTDKISLGDKTIEVVSFHQFQIEKLFNR